MTTRRDFINSLGGLFAAFSMQGISPDKLANWTDEFLEEEESSTSYMSSYSTSSSSSSSSASLVRGS